MLLGDGLKSLYRRSLPPHGAPMLALLSGLYRRSLPLHGAPIPALLSGNLPGKPPESDFRNQEVPALLELPDLLQCLLAWPPFGRHPHLARGSWFPLRPPNPPGCLACRHPAPASRSLSRFYRRHCGGGTERAPGGRAGGGASVGAGRAPRVVGGGKARNTPHKRKTGHRRKTPDRRKPRDRRKVLDRRNTPHERKTGHRRNTPDRRKTGDARKMGGREKDAGLEKDC